MKTKFQNAKVMVIRGNLEADSLGQQKNFDELVNLERKYIRKIVEKITKYKPNIIFVEKSVNRMATDMFLQQNISVV